MPGIIPDIGHVAADVFGLNKGANHNPIVTPTDVKNAGVDVLHGAEAAPDVVGHALYNTSPTGPLPPMGPTNAPAPATRPKVSPLSYQATVAQSLAPLMRQLGGVGNVSAINQALGAVPQAAAGNAAEPNLASGIATSISSQVKDYTQGLNSMMSSVGTAEPLQDLLKGMGELLSYPVVGATGQQGAPAGVSQSPLLQAIYNNLNLIRNGKTVPTDTSTGSGYNQSIDSLVGSSS